MKSRIRVTRTKGRSVQLLLSFGVASVLGVGGVRASTESALKFTEEHRSAYLECAQEANSLYSRRDYNKAFGKSAGTDPSKTQAHPLFGKRANRALTQSQKQKTGGAGSKASPQFRKGGYRAATRYADRCMAGKQVPREVRDFLALRLKLAKMVRPSRTRLPDGEAAFEPAVDKEIARLSAGLKRGRLENANFRACLREARASGLRQGDRRLSAQEFKTAKYSDSGDNISQLEINEFLIFCRDEKTRAQNPTPDPTPTPTGSPTPTTTGSPTSNSAGPGSPRAVIGITPVFTAD